MRLEEDNNNNNDNKNSNFFPSKNIMICKIQKSTPVISKLIEWQKNLWTNLEQLTRDCN